MNESCGVDLGATPTGNRADLDFGSTEFDPLGRKPDVSGKGKFESTAEGISVER